MPIDLGLEEQCRGPVTCQRLREQHLAIHVLGHCQQTGDGRSSASRLDEGRSVERNVVGQRGCDCSRLAGEHGVLETPRGLSGVAAR